MLAEPADLFASCPPLELKASENRMAVIIAGAGPVGLAAALELANHGVTTVVLDKGDRLATGSKAINSSKRSLEIFDRIGIGAGVTRCREPLKKGPDDAGTGEKDYTETTCLITSLDAGPRRRKNCCF